jgi:hypothetical protein
MGNFCDRIDGNLEELMKDEVCLPVEIKCSHDRNSSACTADGATSSISSDEVAQKLNKYRNKIRKLNTIIEDRQEDLLSSPFMLKRLNYS